MHEHHHDEELEFPYAAAAGRADIGCLIGVVVLLGASAGLVLSMWL